MPLYICECCKYTSKIKTQYIRHLNTFKHMRNTQNILISSVSKKKEPQKSQFSAKRAKKEPIKEPKNAQNGEKIAKNGQKIDKNGQKMAKNLQSPKKNLQNQKKNLENFDENMKNSTSPNHSDNITVAHFYCDYCNNKFKTYSNKRRHEKHRCKNNNAVMERNLKIKEHELSILKKQIRDEKNEHKKQIELLLTKVGNTTITNNNIQLNNYGNEDMSHISESFKSELLKIPYGMIPKMIEAIHFNQNKPENKNILLTNKKDNKLKIYSGGKWIYRNKDDILKKLIDGKYFVLDEHYEDICKKIENFKNINYEEFRDKYNQNNKELVNTIKVNSELILLNNR